MAGMSEAVHQLLRPGTGARSECAGKMPEVVQVEPGEAHRRSRVLPRLVQDARGERAALPAGEDVAVVFGLRVLIEMCREVSDERRPDRDRAQSGVSLGWTDESAPAVVDLPLLGDAREATRSTTRARISTA